MDELFACTFNSGGQNDDFRPLTCTLGGGGEGHGVQGQICDILRPQLAMNRFLPPWPHRFPHFRYIHLGKGAGGSDIRSMSSIQPICKCRCPPLTFKDMWQWTAFLQTSEAEISYETLIVCKDFTNREKLNSVRSQILGKIRKKSSLTNLFEII